MSELNPTGISHRCFFSFLWDQKKRSRKTLAFRLFLPSPCCSRSMDACGDERSFHDFTHSRWWLFLVKARKRNFSLLTAASILFPANTKTSPDDGTKCFLQIWLCPWRCSGVGNMKGRAAGGSWSIGGSALPLTSYWDLCTWFLLSFCYSQQALNNDSQCLHQCFKMKTRIQWLVPESHKEHKPGSPDFQTLAMCMLLFVQDAHSLIPISTSAQTWEDWKVKQKANMLIPALSSSMYVILGSISSAINQEGNPRLQTALSPTYIWHWTSSDTLPCSRKCSWITFWEMRSVLLNFSNHDTPRRWRQEHSTLA